MSHFSVFLTDEPPLRLEREIPASELRLRKSAELQSAACTAARVRRLQHASRTRGPTGPAPHSERAGPAHAPNAAALPRTPNEPAPPHAPNAQAAGVCEAGMRRRTRGGTTGCGRTPSGADRDGFHEAGRGLRRAPVPQSTASEWKGVVLSAGMREHVRFDAGGNALDLRKPWHSRVDGQVCPSTRLVMVLRSAVSPYETSTHRRSVQVGGAPHTRRACWLYSSLTRGDWCRIRAAGRGLRSHPTCRPLRSNAGMQFLGAPMRVKALPACGNPSRQGSMGRYAHRPCFPWFANLRIRRTKPPSIAATHGLRAHHTRGGHAGCGRTPTCGDWCRFRAADRGLQLRSTCGRAAGCEGARRLERADCGLRDATGASRMPDERFFTGNVARISTYAARSKT